MSNFAKLQEILKKKKAALKGTGRTIKPKVGKNRFVLLPPWRGGEDVQFWHDFSQHFVKDEAGTLQAIYVCTDGTFGRPCAVCNGLAEAQRTVGVSNPAVAALVKEARAGMSYLVNVLALDSDTPDVPQVLALGKKAFEQLCTNAEEWGEHIFDPKSPQIVIIERTGTTQNDTTYTVTMSPARHAYKVAVKPINLDEFVQQESEEAERKALNAIRHVAGMTTPRLAGGTKDTPQLASPVKSSEFEDVPDLKSTTAAAFTAPETAAPVLTDDIDALLDGLETT